MTGKPIERLRVQIPHRPTPVPGDPAGAIAVQPEEQAIVAAPPPSPDGALLVSEMAPEPAIVPLDTTAAASERSPAASAAGAAVEEPVAPEATTSEATSETATSETATSTTKPLQAQVATQLMRGVRFLGAPFVWLIVLAFCGGTGVSAILWLTTLPPLPKCDRLSLLAADSERLYCAEQAARSGKVEPMLAGLNLIKHWTADHPQFKYAQQLMQRWSTGVMQAAYQKVRQEDLQGAMLLAKKIPPTSPDYATAQRAIGDWRRDYQRGKAFEDSIQPALKAQNWQAVEVQLNDLSKIDGVYWGLLFNRLKQQLITEQLARRQVQQVRLVTASNPTDPIVLGQLIAVLDGVPPTSYVRPEAVTELTRLSQLLVVAINQRLAANDIPGAIATAQRLPETLLPPPEVQPLLQFSQAQTLVNRKIPPQPLAQMGKLNWSLPYLRQIPPQHPLHAQAQALAQQLDQQLQDLTQIQFARSFANLHQVPAYQAAIALAATVAPNRPQRLYAQTLIAQWRLELQTAEARPLLVQANQFAARKTVSSLNAAILLASRIALGHPLRLDAQTAIADWQQQRQLLEDQAWFKQAQKLAQQKKLEAAITLASRIKPGRSLHAQAQTQIQAWTQQLQIAQDRPILDQAAAIAQQGKLDAAIQYAAQIPPGRALYAETQAAIAGWQAQLESLADQTPVSLPPPVPLSSEPEN